MIASCALRLTLLALLAIMPVRLASAGELNAVINGRSFHLDAQRSWNEDNYGLGLEYQFATRSRWKKVVMANGFRDSNNEMSYMAGGGLHRNLFAANGFHDFYIDAGINAFLMTRQDVDSGKPFPGMLPSLTIGNRYMGFNVTYMPRQAVDQLFDERMKKESLAGIVFIQFKVNVARMLIAE